MSTRITVVVEDADAEETRAEIESHLENIGILAEVL